APDPPGGHSTDGPELVTTQRVWSVMTKMAFSADGDGGRRLPELYLVMPIRTRAKSNNRPLLASCLAMILFNPPMISAGANQTETPGPWIVAAKIMRNEQESATAIYLKPGLVVTAAHLTVNWTADLSVHIVGTVLPANLVKQGEVEEVDLSLFSVDDQKLPERIARTQTSLCQAPLGREIRSSLWITHTRPGLTSARRRFCHLGSEPNFAP